MRFPRSPSPSAPRTGPWPARLASAWSILAVPLGLALLAVGLVLLVLPGPGLPVLLVALTLLSRRFPWARRALRWASARWRHLVDRPRRGPPPGRPLGRALPPAAALLLAAGAAGWPAAAGAAPAVPWVDVEVGGVGAGYNDVRIPGQGGTRFSLTDDLSTDSGPYTRVRAGVDLGRHLVHALYAPLRLDAHGVAPGPLTFDDATFAAGTPLRGRYRFDSYRLGYRYAVVQREGLTVALGGTAKIRDAAITVCAATCAVRSNTGFVPLASVLVDWRVAGPFGLLLDVEALGGGPGRAEDVLLAATWRASEQVTARLGARIVEGGADTDSVYNFALLAYLGAGLTVRF